MGSPATLNDVLSSTGIPVRRPYASSSAYNRGAMSRSSAWTRAEPSTCVIAASRPRHSCRTGKTPDMKRASRAPPGGSSKYRSASSIGVTGANGRNSSRYLMSRLSRSRISPACAIHPTDDASAGELVRNPLDERRVTELFDRLAILARRLREFLRIDLRAPEGMIGHVLIRIAEVNAVGIERRPDRASRIARRRWDEYAFEARLGKDSRVGDAVQRDAPAQAEIRQAGFLMQRAGHGHERVLENPLHAGGAIGEALAFRRLQVDRLVRIAWLAEQLNEARRIRLRGRRVVSEVIEIEDERAIHRAPDQLANLLGHVWTSVSGQSHDLVLVLVYCEAQVGGKRRIQHAERMRESDFAKKLDRRAAVRPPLAVTDGERRPLAHAVGGQDRRARRRSGEEGRGRVRVVVAGEQDLRPRHAEIRGDDAAYPDLFAE